VPTRQTSSSGRPKSPRIQVVLPEDLCHRLSLLAEDESRTVSNMAKVLIQQGVERLERLHLQEAASGAASGDGASPASSLPSPGLPAATATHPAALAPPPTASASSVSASIVPPPTVPPPISAPVPPSAPATSGSGVDSAGSGPVPGSDAAADRFRAELERNEAQGPRRLKGVPRRLRLRPPGG
jgi:predicted DNA-binding protein